MNMRRFVGVALLMVAAIPTAALARDCNEVKAEIDAKIKAKGVMNYVLQIVNGPDVKDGQIVGNCELGAKRIVYFKEPNGKNALRAGFYFAEAGSTIITCTSNTDQYRAEPLNFSRLRCRSVRRIVG